ncbi:uncharacterized protein LOC118202293, partial [Stegodyphus dumicola]|uniref:uncharacterized protein LOC118202293 n=1 Tax=Stegodyphus dumicola TaxID=202533 RepID=UPI0015A79FDD
VTEDMLLNIAKLIPPGNDHITSKFSSLIYFLIIKQKVVFHATCIESLSSFMISAIRMSGEWVLNDLLITLSALLSGNADKVVTLHESLIGKNGVLVQLLIPSKFDKSVHFNAFNCLHSLLVKKLGESFIQDDLLNIAYKKCVSFLQVEAFANNISDIASLKILICILKCLQQIFISKNVKIENFGELLGILKIQRLKTPKLLSELELGEKKPSQLLCEMRNLVGNKVTDTFLKTLWLQHLSVNM